MEPSPIEIAQGMKFIRQAAQSGAYLVGSHAYDKMNQLGIAVELVHKCLCDGHFMEYQSGYPEKNECPRVLIYSGHDTEFYVVAGIIVPDCYVISVIQPDWGKWRVDGDTIKRIE